MSKELISQGAEAKLYRKNDRLIKERIPKGYRIEELDNKIRKSRTKGEVKMIGRARRAGVNAPTIFREDDFEIEMEFIDGPKVKNVLDQDNLEEICKSIGRSIGKLHKRNIVHGDLTTSNMILKDDELYLIDFGLSEFSKRDEDKAMDLELLEEALLSAHHDLYEEAMEIIIENYEEENPDSDVILERLEEIKQRGRYV